MSDPITVTLPLWAILAGFAWLSGLLVMLILINTQLRAFYRLYEQIRDRTGGGLTIGF